MTPRPVITKDRMEWLRARKTHVTASEMPKLAKGSQVAARSLAKEKQEEPKEISTRAMDFGHEREPFIIEAVHDKYPHLNIAGNDTLYECEENPFHGGTPDGLGVFKNKYVVCEAKTSNKRVRKVPRAHYIQVNWNMHVMDSDFAIYATEYHEDYIPQDVWITVVRRDEKLIEELIAIADWFEDFMDVDIENENEEELDSILEQYARANFKKAEADAELKALKKRVLEIYGESDGSYGSAKHAFGSISVSLPEPSKLIDAERLRQERPEIAQEFTKLTNTSWTPRIAPSAELKKKVKMQMEFEAAENVAEEDKDNPFA